MSTENPIKNAERALQRPVEEGGERCLCTDSVYKGGNCPDRWDREFYHCPRRIGLFRVTDLDKEI